MPGTDWTVFKLSAASGPISGRRLLSAVTSDDAAAQDVEDMDVSGRADAATSNTWANAKLPSWGSPTNAAPVPVPVQVAEPAMQRRFAPGC